MHTVKALLQIALPILSPFAKHRWPSARQKWWFHVSIVHLFRSPGLRSERLMLFDVFWRFLLFHALYVCLQVVPGQTRLASFKIETTIAYGMEQRLCLQDAAKPSVHRSNNLLTCHSSAISFQGWISSHLISFQAISGHFIWSNVSSFSSQNSHLIVSDFLQFHFISCRAFSFFARHLLSFSLPSSLVFSTPHPTISIFSGGLMLSQLRKGSVKMWKRIFRAKLLSNLKV